MKLRVRRLPRVKRLLARGPAPYPPSTPVLRMPPGALVAYKDVAEHLGKPKASWAVANAVAQNSISYLSPCHRGRRSNAPIRAPENHFEKAPPAQVLAGPDYTLDATHVRNQLRLFAF